MRGPFHPTEDETEPGRPGDARFLFVIPDPSARPATRRDQDGADSLRGVDADWLAAARIA